MAISLEIELYNKEPLALSTIEFNKDTLIKIIEEEFSVIGNTVYIGENDGLSRAKNDIARLRKAKNFLETERRRIKSDILEGYNKFEKEMKDITSLLDKYISNVDGSIKTIERERKLKKEKKIAEMFITICDELDFKPEDFNSNITAGYIFSKIKNDKWLNVSASQNSIKQEMKEKIERIKTELKTLSYICEDKNISQGLQDIYIQELDIESTVKFYNDFKLVSGATDDGTKNASEVSEGKFNINISLKVTLEELVKTKSFFNNNNIEWQRI